MSLSEYEKTEFERITAGLHFGDPVTLSEMEGPEQENTSEHNLSVGQSAWTGLLSGLALVILDLSLIPVAIYFSLVGDAVLAAGLAITSLVLAPVISIVAFSGNHP